MKYYQLQKHGSVKIYVTICYKLMDIILKDGTEMKMEGGVGCFIKDNISYVRRSDLEESELEIMWLEIITIIQSYLVLCTASLIVEIHFSIT